MEKKVYDIIKRSINKTIELKDDMTLLELGIDSVEFITVIIALEEELDIRFEDTLLIYENYNTIGQLVSVIQQSIEQ